LEAEEKRKIDERRKLLEGALAEKERELAPRMSWKDINRLYTRTLPPRPSDSGPSTNMLDFLSKKTDTKEPQKSASNKKIDKRKVTFS